MMKFTELELDKNLLKGIKKAGYAQCTPAQEETLKQTMANRDVCVQSQTGTGKTAAFLISIFHNFIQDKTKKALIIVPTRELAVQIEEEARLIGHYLDFRIGSIFGGVGYIKQEKLLEEGVDIIVGTPGRLIDLGLSGKLDFKEFKILVIDEADRLFDMGFLPDLRKIIKKMRPASERMNMLFGATLNTSVRQLSWEYMNDPFEIEIEPEQVTVEKIAQELYHVGRSEKMKLLLGILKRDNPKNVLIFTNTKRFAAEVSERLKYNGYSSKYISGDLPQKKRLKIMDSFKAGKFSILVATDVAARGLHIEDLEMVINYDLPTDCENYVHRIGRTARAGKSGKAISLPCEEFVYSIEAIEEYIQMKIPVSWADDSLFEKDKSQGVRFSIKTGTLETPRERRKDTEQKKPRGKTASIQERSNRKSAKGPVRKKTERAESSSAPSSKRTKKPKQTAEKNTAPRPAPPKDKNLESRLEYYSKKYGDKFTLSDEDKSLLKKEKKSFFKRIADIFRK